MVAVVVIGLWLATRRARPEVIERGWAAYAAAAIAGPLALLMGGGSVADVGDPAWTGMVVGLVCGRRDPLRQLRFCDSSG